MPIMYAPARAVAFAESQWNWWTVTAPQQPDGSPVTPGTLQPDYECAEFVTRCLAAGGAVSNMQATGTAQSALSAWVLAGTAYNLLATGHYGAAPYNGLYEFMAAQGYWTFTNNPDVSTAQPGDVLWYHGEDGSGAVSDHGHVVLVSTGQVGAVLPLTDSHNEAEHGLAVNGYWAGGSPDTCQLLAHWNGTAPVGPPAPTPTDSRGNIFGLMGAIAQALWQQGWVNVPNFQSAFLSFPEVCGSPLDGGIVVDATPGRHNGDWCGRANESCAVHLVRASCAVRLYAVTELFVTSCVGNVDDYDTVVDVDGVPVPVALQVPYIAAGYIRAATAGPGGDFGLWPPETLFVSDFGPTTIALPFSGESLSIVGDVPAGDGETWAITSAIGFVVPAIYIVTVAVGNGRPWDGDPAPELVAGVYTFPGAYGEPQDTAAWAQACSELPWLAKLCSGAGADDNGQLGPWLTTGGA